MVSAYLSDPVTVAIVALILAICVFIRALFFRKKTDRLADDLRLTQKELAVALADIDNLQRKQQTPSDFKEDLYEAELTTKLQKPRLTVQHDRASVNTPERYRYVRSLAEKGMSAEEIASVLQISIQEARQLVNLSKLATTTP